MSLTKTEQIQEDLTNEKYEILTDTYAFVIDKDTKGFYVKYSNIAQISPEGKRGDSIDSLVSEAYDNHLEYTK